MQPLSFIAALVICASASAQGALFQENFDSGLPSTWQNIHLQVVLDPWGPGLSLTNGSPDIYHEYFCHNGTDFRDNIVLSPPIDLSSVTKASFLCAQYQRFPLARVQNTVEVTTDDGATFTTVYTETGTWQFAGTIAVSLNAFAGNPAVRMAFHYRGAIANEWSIDDVRVSSDPSLMLNNLRAGHVAQLAVAGCAAGNQVAVAMSLTGGGAVSTPYGILGLSLPIEIVFIGAADATGAFSVTPAVPSGTAGLPVWIQACEITPGGSVTLSNTLALTVG